MALTRARIEQLVGRLDARDVARVGRVPRTPVGCGEAWLTALRDLAWAMTERSPDPVLVERLVDATGEFARRMLDALDAATPAERAAFDAWDASWTWLGLLERDALDLARRFQFDASGARARLEASRLYDPNAPDDVVVAHLDSLLGYASEGEAVPPCH